jgi:two-component system, sensor histidine kinase and response regulator
VTVEDHDDVIDEEILSELLTIVGEAEPEGLTKAFELFLTGVPARLDAVETALAEGRLEAAAQSAHSLRGSAGAFGARRLSVLAARQELLCNGGDGAGAAALLGPMHAQFATVQAILRDRLTSLAA